ncbi:MAG TPA: hypothetical protein VIM61_09345 [Chthoniobacterales bacterium]
MLSPNERARRMNAVKRISVSLALKDGERMPHDVPILTDSLIQMPNAPTAKELDAKKPIGTDSKGNRYFIHVRQDGRGQINIQNVSGLDRTIKFDIPEHYLPEDEGIPFDAPLFSTPLGYKETPLDHVTDSLINADEKYPVYLAQIPTFPVREWASFRDAIAGGEMAVGRFAFKQESQLLGLVADKGTQHLHMFFALLFPAGPLIAVALGFLFNFWWFLGLIAFPVIAFIGAKRVYNNAILRAAMRDERTFCFLFYCGQIHIVDHKNRKSYDWPKISEAWK